MSSILVTDILQELREENKRLCNELLYAKQCLKVLTEFKINFDFYSNKFKQSLEINEWKKFEKLNEEIIGIVFKLCGNRVNTNSDYITEDVIKTEETFNENINDNSNERPIETTLESNEQVLNETINSGNNLINNNNFNDINREMNNEINFCQPIDNNSRGLSMNIIDSIQGTSTSDHLFDESLQKSVISYIQRNNSLFKETSNEHLGQTSDQLVSQDINRNEQNLRAKCDICDRSYSNKNSLSKHKSITHRKRNRNPLRKCPKDNEKTTPFKCDICHRSYSNKKSLRMHRYQCHNIRIKPVIGQDDREIFACDLCNSKFSNNHNLISHMRIKHDITTRKKCPKCPKFILTDSRLKVHLNMHQNNGVFKCWHNGCDKVKHSETKAMNHLYIHKVNEKFEENPNEKLKYSCDWPGCDYKGKSEHRIREHKTAIHYLEDTTRILACSHPGCGKKFKTKKSLSQHLETHKTGERVQCQHCGKDYKDSTGLKIHVFHVHNNERNFVCNHSGCEYSTTTASRLKIHASSHFDRSIACTVEGCDKRFKTSKQMKYHLTTHTTEYNYKCPFDGCDKRFKTEKGSKTHYKKQHTENEILRCDWPGCDFQTKFSISHLRHRDVHKTERDFICEWPECGKGFKSKKQLELHTRRHTNDKRYVCLWPGCQYSTTDSPNFIKHRKQVHEKTSNYYRNKK